MKSNTKRRSESRDYINIRLYLLILTLLFISASPLLLTPAKSVLVLLILVVVLFCNYRLIITNFKWPAILLVAFIPSIIIDIRWALDYGFTSLSGFYIIISALTASFLAIIYDFQRFSYIYQKVVWHLVLLSLAIYCLVLIAPTLVSLGISYDYDGHIGDSFIIQNFMYNDDSGVFVLRNAGFASEPGIFQCFVNIALVLGLKDRKTGGAKIAIYGLAIFTTVSTIGVVTYSLIVLAFLPSKYKAVAIAIAVVFSGAVTSYLIGHYEAKLAGTVAYTARMDPTVNAWYLFLDYPFGYGSIRYTKFYKLLDIGSWDSYTQIMLRSGLTGLFLLCALLFRVIRKEPALGCVMALSFVSNSFWFAPAIAVFFFFEKFNPKPMRSLR